MFFGGGIDREEIDEGDTMSRRWPRKMLHPWCLLRRVMLFVTRRKAAGWAE